MKRGSSSGKKRKDGRESRRRRRNSPLKVLLFFTGCALIPFTASLIINLPILFSRYRTLSPPMIWTGLGFVFFVIVFFLFGAPVRTYILEHELSHILVAVLSGTKIRRVSFHARNAYVRTDRVNLFIALVPYSLPLYTLFIILLLKLIQQFTSVPLIMDIFYFTAGLMLSFHFVATIYYLQLEQPDTQRYGSFASLILVTTWAIIILVLVLALMFEDVQVMLFFRESVGDAGVIYRYLYDLFHLMYVFFLTI